MIRDQFLLDVNDELIVDNFAGGGGASHGIEMALGRHVDVAINHDRKAIAMHQANHPQTLHLPKSVWEIAPLVVTKGRPVGLAWFSPDCKHFSKAKGGKPREKAIRALAWIVVKWILDTRPRVIMLENVEEFQDWCPVDDDGQPIKDLLGRTFEAFRGIITTGIPADHPDIQEALQMVAGLTVADCVRGFGYSFGSKELRACDYGAPTIRKRLFAVMRRDGSPAFWPDQTHAAPTDERVKAGRLKAWLTAASCIDFSIPCPSIFERKRPLAAATCRRVAKGIMKFVIDAVDPFIVHLTHHGDDRVHDPKKPFPTVTGANRGELAIVSPTLIQTGYGERPGQEPRAPGLDKPLGTVVAGGVKHAIVAPILAETAHGEESPGTKRKRWGAGAQDIAKPLNTVAGSNNAALVSLFLAKNYTGVIGIPADAPTGTVTTQDHHSLVAATLVRDFGTANASDIQEPAKTVMADGGGGKTRLVAATLTRQFGNSNAADIKEPVGTTTAGGSGKTQMVYAFLDKYYGTDQDPQMREPLHTVTTKDRFGLVMVNGIAHAIIDIGLRMLQPRELFRAQGFPDSYIIDKGFFVEPDGAVSWKTLTKSDQVRMCGNSVCPPMAAALVAANVPELSCWTKSERRARSAGR